MGYFAHFERRAAGVIIDFLAMFFLAVAIQMSILEPLGLNVREMRPVIFAVAVLYFSVSWASPLSATPVQWLLRIRVVNKSGERLGLSQAALRAMLLMGGIMAAMTLFKVPENPKLKKISLLISPASIEKELRNAGFEIDQMAGDLTGSPLEPENDLIGIIASLV